MTAPGSSRPAVRRDALGVAHLWADDVVSLARLQGETAARDRAWQLEHHRWRMEGRVAEHEGPSGVAWDRFARQVRLEHTARRCFEGLDDETREFVEAYVDGVNSALSQGLSRSTEMRLLGLETLADRPRPWAPWTPLGIFWGIHLLFGTFPAKLFASTVAERLGEPWLPLFATEGVHAAGSNAWVVGGHRTASGLPIVAGDPHRTIDLPSCYQQVGLACPGVDVVGFTFPGVPGVQHFAHAGSVAWGITNAMADYQDLTLEQLRPSDAGGLEARGPAGWEAAHSTTETVAVRGGSPVEVSVVVTPRGPVVTGLDDETGATHSLRTPTQTGADLGFAALLPLLRARSTADVVAALDRWVEPVNSALVADVDGDVRHLLAGRVPVRPERNRYLPVPAWDPERAWQPGWAERQVGVVDDVMVSANDRASGGGLGVDYATPFRARRIRELVGDRTGLTVDDCAAIHADTLNGQAAPMAELVGAVEESALSPAAAGVRRRLLAWDGHSDPGSAGAALFATWRHAFVRWVAGHPVLAPLHEPTGWSPLFLPWVNVTVQVGAAWPTLARLAGTDERYGIRVGDGVRAALEAVAAQVHDTSTAPTTWGETHRLRPVHALSGRPGAPAPPDVAVAGDRGCVLAASSGPGVDDACLVGPVARYAWQVGDVAASGWTVPFGSACSTVESTDPHAFDQLDAWVAVRLGAVGGGLGEGAAGAQPR